MTNKYVSSVNISIPVQELEAERYLYGILH